MTEDQKNLIKGYVATLNSDIVAGDLLDLVVDTVAERVLLYLNEVLLPIGLERVIAQMVVASYQTIQNPQEQSISSVSDNGQSVSYHQTPVNHFATKSDGEIFGGFEKLLAPYRRVHVITS